MSNEREKYFACLTKMVLGGGNWLKKEFDLEEKMPLAIIADTPAGLMLVGNIDPESVQKCAAAATAAIDETLDAAEEAAEVPQGELH